MSTQTENGGFYAIKGFEFQIDKTILEILTLEDLNKSVSIENIQDLDSVDFVMQVKYRETKNYTDIEIREPVIQLIEEFSKNPLKKYKLYCHFKNKEEAIEGVDMSRLESILTLSKGASLKAQKINRRINYFSEELKKSFIKNFELIFAAEHQIQLEKVLSTVAEILEIDGENAVFHHGNLSNYLRRKALKDKVCTKKELLAYIKCGRNLIFTSSFSVYQGESAYFKFIKNKYFTSFNKDDFERFFIIELRGDESVSDIKTELLKIKNKFYIKAGISVMKIIKSGAPYVYFKNITTEKLKQLKTEMMQEGHIFKDGHDFFDAEFCLESIKQYSTVANDICIKFVNTENNLNNLVQENLGKTKEVFQFFINNPYDLQLDVKDIQIHVKNLSDISFII